MSKFFKNKNILRSIFVLLFGGATIGLVLAYSNCSSPNNGSNNSAAGITSAIAISPANVSLALGASQTFTASGGTGSYSFNLTSGGGSIGQTTGVYTAPTTDGSATVQVVDTNQDTAYANVIIGSGVGGGGGGGVSGGYYSCPVIASDGCTDTSLCQSSCIGQYTNQATCLWYSADATPNTENCNSASIIYSAYSCPLQPSNSCDSASACESTCLGQIQPGSTCVTDGYGGASTTQNCTLAPGGSISIYACPLQLSTGCNDMSVCESTCMGQYTTQSTCTTYSENAVPSTVQCTFVGTTMAIPPTPAPTPRPTRTPGHFGL